MLVGHLPFMEKTIGLLTAGNAVLSVLNQICLLFFPIIWLYKTKYLKKTNKYFVDSQYFVYYGVNYAGTKS